MADPHEFMSRKIAEYDKKYPDRSHLFISTMENDLMMRTEIDGWQVIKEAGSGVAGEIRCGELVLASRPRKMSEDERKANATRTRGQFAATEQAYYGAINQAGGHGRYLAPMTPAELERDAALPPNPKS